jgi:hypothetical protein
MPRSLVACLIAVVALGAAAAEPARQPDTLYSVELIIFRPTTPLGVAEDWRTQAAATLNAGTPASDSDAAQDTPAPSSAGTLDAKAMSPALFRLSGTESSLERSRAYEVLGHIGWTQTAVPRGSGLSADLAQLGLGNSAVSGSVAVERGRYLYLRLSLAYTPADPPATLVGTTAPTERVTFTLNQVRRVRNFERHYFDHPAFGVIAMVAPVSSAP